MHLEELARRRNAPAREVQRAKMVLGAAEGLGNAEIARRTGACAHTVSYWRHRFVQRGMLGPSEMPRSGAPRQIADKMVERVVRTTLEKRPEGATHWSTRRLAARLGLSHQSIARIWRAFGLQPHRSETFGISNDPHFVAKVRDVVGTYLSPRTTTARTKRRLSPAGSRLALIGICTLSQPIRAGSIKWNVSSPC